jgi:hypothetical protein
MNNAAPSSHYVIPGTFIGIWTIKNVTTPCVAIISKSDSLLLGIIKNDSTNEVLTLRKGYLVSIDPPVGQIDPYFYFGLHDSSSFYGDTNLVLSGMDGFNFADNGNSLYFSAQRGRDTLTIVCKRK